MTCRELPMLVDLDEYAGDSWSQTFRLLRGTEPVDLTGSSVAAWAIDVGGLALDLVVTTDDSEGLVTLQPPAGGLAPGRWRYDLEVNEAGAVTTWVHGTIRIQEDVTHAA